MTPGLSSSLSAKQAQVATLAPQLRQGLKMLAMNLPELRAELIREMSLNPVIEDVEPTLERTTVSDKEAELKSREEVESSDYPDDSYSIEDGYASGLVADTEALERRQRFLESQTRDETLEEHLLAQLAVSDIAREDVPLAELLIGDLDDNGLFAGSIPDIMMVSGESESKVRDVLAKIAQLDPPGCGATNLKECLLAQTDKLDGSPYHDEVCELIEGHLEDVAANRIGVIEKSLGIDHDRYSDVLRALRTLDPRPGRAFRRGGKGVEYVNPEVHVTRSGDGWVASVDARSLPEIRISRKYLELLNNPETDAETKAYVRERIAAAEALREAVLHREDTVSKIAQAIVDAQPGFFTDGLKGLTPMTMEEIAKKVGVHHTTVSRTVNDKYASTPKGTVELRKFFTQGFVSASGEQITKDVVADRIRALIDAEDKANPLSDERISKALEADGLKVARRTVAKYRIKLDIPGTADRRGTN